MQQAKDQQPSAPEQLRPEEQAVLEILERNFANKGDKT